MVGVRVIAAPEFVQLARQAASGTDDGCILRKNVIDDAEDLGIRG